MILFLFVVLWTDTWYVHREVDLASKVIILSFGTGYLTVKKRQLVQDLRLFSFELVSFFLLLRYFFFYQQRVNISRNTSNLSLIIINLFSYTNKSFIGIKIRLFLRHRTHLNRPEIIHKFIQIQYVVKIMLVNELRWFRLLLIFLFCWGGRYWWLIDHWMSEIGLLLFWVSLFLFFEVLLLCSRV